MHFLGGPHLGGVQLKPNRLIVSFDKVVGYASRRVAAMSDRAIYLVGGVSAIITLSALVTMVVVYWQM
jgi:hypothetical protein